MARSLTQQLGHAAKERYTLLDKVALVCEERERAGKVLALASANFTRQLAVVCIPCFPTRNLRPGTRNPKPQTRNLKPKISKAHIRLLALTFRLKSPKRFNLFPLCWASSALVVLLPA